MYNNLVGPEGSKDSKIAFIAEAPAFEEVNQGRPLVGRSGQLFNFLLTQAGLVRNHCYITNLFKFMVQKRGDYIVHGDVKLFSTKKNEFTSTGEKHRLELIEELKSVNANVLVPMGGPALNAITDKKGITKWRGSILKSYSVDRKVVPMIHPAAALRQYIYRYWLVWDIKRAKIESETPEINLPDRHYIVEPSFSEVMAKLESYEKEPILGFDIEILNLEVSHISFAKSWDDAISIPFVSFASGSSPYYLLPEENTIWRKVCSILENEKIEKVGQNLEFDISVLFQKYGILTKNYHDTMVAHKIVFPDYPASLAFITSTRTREPYYKDDLRIHNKPWGAQVDIGRYNCKDSMICVETMPSLIKDLKRLQNEETYEVHRKLIEPTIYMGIRGLKVDTEMLAKVREESRKKIEELQEELNSIVGTPLNPRSTKQVAAYFYIEKGLSPYKKGGKTTTEKGALKRIARKGFREAKIMLDMRSLSHDISTYYDVKLKEGRLVCSYKPVTSMGRLASSKDIFDFGTNMQNQPKEKMNRLFIADEGCLLYNVDLSQADNRSVAYMGPEHRMMQAFEDGRDVHSLTASLIFGFPYDEIIQMHKEKVKSDIGYGDRTHRDWGKQCNHAFNFGRGYRTFSYEFEIPEKEGKELWRSYHNIYHGVEKSYHKWIRDKLSQDRTLTNCFGRKYRFVERWGEELFKQAYAFPAQSNTADVLNRWGVLPMYYDTAQFEHVELLRQVHDSINFQIPIDKGIAYHCRCLKAIKKSLEQPLKWKIQEFVIPAEFEVGFRLSEMKELDFNKPLEGQLNGLFKRDNSRTS